MWSFIKITRIDSAGVAPLRSQGDTSSDKAKILNRQFSSVFTQENPGSMPDKRPSSFPSTCMPQIVFSTPDVKKLLDNSGPDLIPPIVLKELSNQIAPILQIIFQISLTTGPVPYDWKEANVAPIFKKGDKHKPSNYRSVSLTCIALKIMEYIIVSNLMKHHEIQKIPFPLQHGFRRNHS